MHIEDSTSIDDPANKAVAKDFFHCKAIPLPEEVDESIEFISTTSPIKLRSFWGAKLKRVAE